MHNAENVLPILITECGSLQNGRQAADNWLRVLAWNALLTKTMQRPDQIELFVPFVFLHMPWNPISGDAVFTPKGNRQQHLTIDDFDATPIANFFELWRDFDGRRLPVAYDRDWLDVVAIHSNNKISLAVTNMGGRQLLLDLSSIHQQYPKVSAQQTRLNYHEGDLTFQPNQPVEINAIPVDVNETTVIHLVPKKENSTNTRSAPEPVLRKKNRRQKHGQTHSFQDHNSPRGHRNSSTACHWRPPNRWPRYATHNNDK
jgi:agarase